LYFHAIEKFKYIGLLIFYGLFIGLTTFVAQSDNKLSIRLKKYVNWLSVLGVILILMLVSLFAYIEQVNKLNLAIKKVKIISNIGIGNIFYFLRGFFTVFLATFFVVFVARLLGNLITTIVFYMGAFSLLQWYFLLPVFVLVILLNWKKALSLLKGSVRPIAIPQNLNWMGGLAIAFMLIITAINSYRI